MTSLELHRKEREFLEELYLSLKVVDRVLSKYQKTPLEPDCVKEARKLMIDKITTFTSNIPDRLIRETKEEAKAELDKCPWKDDKYGECLSCKIRRELGYDDYHSCWGNPSNTRHNFLSHLTCTDDR
jgi:hypothetical protein